MRTYRQPYGTIGRSDMKVWVIGGTSGIGSAISAECWYNGYQSISTGTEVDVRYPFGLKDIIDRNDGFDAIVYSAGINRLMHIKSTDMKQVEEIFTINVFGFMNLLRVLENSKTKTKTTSVLAISSDAATRPMRTSIAYCSSKAALDMAVRCAAREIAPVRVNAISPGMTAGTAMTKYIDETVPEMRGWTPQEALDYETSQIPMKRRASPMEIAKIAVAVLTGPAYLTGAIIPVNGGR